MHLGFSVSAGGDIGWPNSNRLVLSLYYYPNEEGARVYIKWPVESPDRLVSLEVVADPEKTVCPAVSRVNRTVTERPEMTLHGLEKNCVYEVTVTVRTRFNELGLSEVSNISTILPPQNIDWVVAPISKTELSTILKYRPPPTNPALLKNFTFVILKKGAEKERIIVNVNENVSRQMDDHISVTTDQVLQSQSDETVFLNVSLKTRLSQGEDVELRVFTNRDEVTRAVYTLKPPIFVFIVIDDDDDDGGGDDEDDDADDDDDDDDDDVDDYEEDDDGDGGGGGGDPIRFWEAAILSVKSRRISFRWTTPIFGNQHFLFVLLEAEPIGGEKQGLFISATETSGALEGLQPWTYYNITITAIYTHGWYEKKIGMCQTAIEATNIPLSQSVKLAIFLTAPPAPDFVKATVAGPGIISLSWSPITAFGGKELYYKAACRDANWKLLEPPVRLNTTSIIFKRLNDCTQYKCKVTAMAVGDRTQEAERPLKVKLELVQQLRPEGVSVSWQEATITCGAIEYTIHIKPVRQHQAIGLEMKYPSNVTKALISGLEDNAHYEVRVRYDILPDRDGHGGGVGEFSEPKQFWTWPQAPSKPTDVTARVINNSAIRVSWNPPDRAGGIISAYTVYTSFLLRNGTAKSRNLTGFSMKNKGGISLVVGDLPSRTLVKVTIRATTKSSFRGEGGGPGDVSRAVFVLTAADDDGRTVVVGTTAPTTSDGDPVITCPHCARTFTSRNGLLCDLRIHRTETGEPVPGTPTRSKDRHLRYPHCPRAFNQHMSLFGHMRIHDIRIHRNADSTDSPRTLSAPAIATTTNTTTTTTADVNHPAPTDLSYPHCTRNFTSRIGLAHHLRIHRTETGEPVPGGSTYNDHVRLDCHHCFPTFTNLVGLLGHMPLHDNLR
ncbi:unnamed protein product [Schistocephalus solidus]|uniref:Protein-tyrosine-phosphatase n=1 Tax=Schistocephalus solidus TaxID=70667 RepID=A0A183TB23_SCHSO|nr:unnamed protein product [Schistocephalus solidus]